MVFHLSRIRIPAIKDFLIRGFIRLYKVDLDEVAARTPVDFPTFNDFFTRELLAGMRPVDGDARAIVSPVDGSISLAGKIEHGQLLQAKGLHYSLEDLFAVNLENTRHFADGKFATIYLAPHNYHRVHMPIDGELLAAHYVPGDVYSVNEATVARVAGLFRRNERLNLHFATAIGPVSLIFVGALNVGSISTPWTGIIRPRKRGVVEAQEIASAPTALAKGDLLGWFNMGSTVILLLPASTRWQDRLQPGAAVRMGECIGRIQKNRGRDAAPTVS
jgi:phosphatidylserine decarboxylase